MTSATEFELEVRELAQAAARESERRLTEAKALRRAGLEQLKTARALRRQSEYYQQLIR